MTRRSLVDTGRVDHVKFQESFSQNRKREFAPLSLLRDGVGDGDRDSDRACGGDNFDEAVEDGMSRYCGGGSLPRRISISMTSPRSSLATAGAHALSDIRTVR